ncbi:MAG: InlB B-repeat-containing protein [Roseburia sp.]
MNREVKKRKKRFWALCLAMAVILSQVVPLNTLAATYTANDACDEIRDENNAEVQSLQPGDKVQYNKYSYDEECIITYQDSDGSVLRKVTCEIPANSDGEIEVKKYSDVSPDSTRSAEQLDEQLKEWKITYVNVGSGDILKDMTLQAELYTQSDITYILNGGTNDSANPSIYYEGKEAITLADATREGYTFEGWYSNSDFSGSKVTSIPVTQTGNVTLYAKFTRNTYSISYNLDGGTNASANPDSYTYETGVASFADASKTGYTFEGWYSDAAFTTKVTSISATQTGNITLYAKFTANTYNITYNLDGGTNVSDNPASYTYGTGVTSLADASKEGYTFAGWYSDSAFTTKVTSISSTQTGNVTLYAKFTKNENQAKTYSMLDGANGTWTLGNTGTLTFRGDGEFSKFTEVKVDGKTVDKGNYDSKEGSTIVSLKDSYLNTLSVGTHTFEMAWTDGSASTSFTVVEATPAEPEQTEEQVQTTAPVTGDSTPFGVLFAVVLLSGTGLILIGTKRIKKRS